MSTMISISRGKWLPGAKDSGISDFYCHTCERAFANSNSLGRHLNTELHFKRKSNLVPSAAAGSRYGSYIQDPNFFEQVPQIRIRSQRTCVRKSSSGQRTLNDIIYCPTCYASVEKRQMGKHLVSHFHCQKTSTKGRLIDPEKNLILEHIRDIVLQSPFQCGNCNFYFTQKSQLLSHFTQHHSKLKIKLWSEKNVSYGWSCSACTEICVPDVESIIQHLNSESHLKMETAIDKSIPIIIRQVVLQSCTACTKQFKLRRQLLSHVRNEHQQESAKSSDSGEDENVTPIVQTSCNLTHGEAAELIVDNCPNDPDKPRGSVVKSQAILSTDRVDHSHICLECSALFSSQNSLNRHISHAHPMENGYTCNHCSYTIRKRSHFLRHLKTHDKTRVKMFQCDECEAKFHVNYALTFHKKIHSGKTIKCDFPDCNYTGRSNADVKGHSVMHQSVNSHPCKQCSYSTKSRKHLLRHIKLRHSQTASIKLYSCRYCPFNAKLKDGLKRHEQKHTNERIYVCPYCDYETHDLEFIRSHIVKRNQHPGKFLYYCRLCLINKSTPYQSNQFQGFQHHVTQEHANYELRNSKHSLFVIAGLQHQDGDIDDEEFELPEFTKEEPLKVITKRLRDEERRRDLNGIGIMEMDDQVEKDASIVLIPEEYAAVGIPVHSWKQGRGRNEISKVNENAVNPDISTNCDNNVVSPFDPELNFVSPFVGSEINLDIDENDLRSEQEVLPQSESDYKVESYSYCDLSNALLSTVEDLEDILH